MDTDLIEACVDMSKLESLKSDPIGQRALRRIAKRQVANLFGHIPKSVPKTIYYDGEIYDVVKPTRFP